MCRYLEFRLLINAFFIIAAWLGLKQLENEIRKNTVTSLQTISTLTQQSINKTWAKVRFSAAKEWAADSIVIDNTIRLLENNDDSTNSDYPCAIEALTEFFEPKISSFDVQGIFIIDPDKLSAFSMRKENIGSTNLICQFYPDRFERVMEGQQQLIPPIRSDVPLKNSAGELIEGYPTMFLIVPIVHNDRTMAALSLRFDPFREFSFITQNGRIGKTGETYILNKEGKMLTESRFKDELYEYGLLGTDEYSILNVEIKEPSVKSEQDDKRVLGWNKQPLTQMASSIAKEESGYSLQAYNDYLGKPVLGAWLWDDELEIGFASEIDEGEALESYKRGRRIVLELLTLIIVSFLIVRIIIGRINNRITDQEKYINSTLDSILDPVFVVDHQGLIETVNKSGILKFGYTEKELVNKSFTDLFDTNDSNAGPIVSESYLNENQGEISDLTTKKKNGEKFRVRLIFNTVKFNKRTIKVFVFYDITKDKKNEDILKQRQVEIEKKNLDLEKSRKAALSLMQDANMHKKRIEETHLALSESTEEIRKLSLAME